jgi:glucose/arabinose dehydrogenase
MRGIGSTALASMLVMGLAGAASAGPAYEADVELIAEGLVAPLALAEVPDGSGRLLVLEQIGRIRVIDADGKLLAEPFLDFRKRLDPTIEPGFDERGALGLALHPEFAENGKLYVYYSAPLRQDHTLTAAVDWGAHTSHIAELAVSPDDPNRADPDYERLLFQIDQPQFAHNAGTLAFGPDGMLYISLGDGGSAPENGDYPIEGTSQHGDNLLGKILRVNVEGENGLPYGIPPDNPFVDQEGFLPEIFALGFRNPFRLSIDHETGTVYVGDVGQNSYEEIDLVEPGGNYGWAIKEATHCFDWGDFEGHFEGCDDAGLIDPIIEYKNGGKHPDESEGRSTVGGFIYRGAALPELQGKLVFADWGIDGGQPSGVVYVGTPGDDATAPWSYARLQLRAGSFPHFILSLGEDADRELYILTHDSMGPEGETGRLFKIVPKAG